MNLDAGRGIGCLRQKYHLDRAIHLTASHNLLHGAARNTEYPVLTKTTASLTGHGPQDAVVRRWSDKRRQEIPAN